MKPRNGSNRTWPPAAGAATSGAAARTDATTSVAIELRIWADHNPAATGPLEAGQPADPAPAGDTLKAVKIALGLLLALALAGPAAAVAAEPQATLPDVEDEVMCVECGTALNVSTSPVADQERAFIRRRIAEGKSKAEIKAALVEEYGPRVLAVPEGGGFDVAAWLVPGVLSLAALLGVGIAALHWRRRPAAAPATTGAGEELDPEDARRLDADLAAHDR
jgi:cytochrome c-type biogenesis protein CcmH